MIDILKEDIQNENLAQFLSLLHWYLRKKYFHDETCFDKLLMPLRRLPPLTTMGNNVKEDEAEKNERRKRIWLRFFNFCYTSYSKIGCVQKWRSWIRAHARYVSLMARPGPHIIVVLSFVLLISSKLATSHNIVRFLPGFLGPFRFLLETGFIC